MVVCRWSGDRLVLRDGLDQLAAEFRFLATLKIGNGIQGAAEAHLHGVCIVAGQLKGALEAAEGVNVVAEDDIVGRFLVVVVEAAPGGDEFASVGLGDAGIDLRPLDAGRLVGAPHGRSLAAANPAGGPAMLGDVVIEGGEVSIGGAVAAVVVEDGQFLGSAVGKAHPVEPAQVDSADERIDDVIAERNAPHVEGFSVGGRLGRGAIGGDDQGRIVLDGDLADGGPVLDGKGTRDPGDHILILLGVEVDPAEGVGGLLGVGCPAARKNNDPRISTQD